MQLPYAGHTRLLGKYLAPQKGRVFMLAALLLAGIGFQLLNPQVVRYFIDTAQAPLTGTDAGDPMGRLLLAALVFLVAGLAARGLGLAAAYEGLRVSWTATNALRADLLDHVLRLDLSFHKLHTPGELIERVDGDPGMLGEFFSQTVIKTAANLLLAAGILFFLYREDVRAGLALTIYAGIAILALVALQRYGTRRWDAARAAWADQNGYIEERLAGSEDIRGIGAEGHALSGLDRLTGAVLLKQRGAWMAQALGASVTSFLYAVSYGLGLAIGSWLYLRGEVTIGSAFIIVYYIGMLSTPLDALREQAGTLQQATAGVERVESLFATQPKIREAAGADLPGGALGVSLEDISFTYRDRGDDLEDAGGPALSGVSFDLAPGRVLGVLGRTGSGKSTLTRLLFRLYNPDAGAIRLGGVDLRDVALDELRRRAGMVTQDVQLFGASLRDNIALFDPGVSDAMIWEALERLGLREWVAAMPGGLDAMLATGGANLSAGEGQLVAFARLLLRDPGLVILDEAAARLDPITEARLERAIDRLLAGRTGIIIAHRLETLQRADDILALEGGQVVEFGPRAALAADPTSRYSRLLRSGLEEALA
jgi:ABC-type multidrug transport system fused ATPase/permease subunit